MKFFTPLLLCLFSFWFTASPLLAGPLDAAREAFSSGDFAKAGKLAGKAAKKLKSKPEKAEAYAIAGAAAVKMGKAGKGKGKFVKALKLDPNVALPSEASGDKKVEKAFASAQKKAGTSVSDGGSSGGSDKLTKTSSRANKSPSNLKNYLPFGINNYMQGKTITAVVMAGAQVGGLLLYLNQSQAISDANKDAADVISKAQEGMAESDEEFQKFLTDNDAFVKSANSMKSIALLLTAAGYGLSVVDALFDPLGTAKTASLESDSQTSYANLGTEGMERRTETPWTFDLQIIPSKEAGLMASMKKSF